MDINYIHEFVVLEKIRNYLDASEELHLAQSSLSRHIQRMEEELGVTLFNRTTRGIDLSDAGKIFLPYAREIARLQKEYTLLLSQQIQSDLTTINVGVMPVMAQYKVTDLIAQFQQENEDFIVNIIEGDANTDLRQLLLEDKCDFVIINHADDYPPNFGIIPFVSDYLVAVLPSRHPLARQGFNPLPLKMLRNEPFLFLSRESHIRRLCDEACRNAGFEPHIRFSSSRAENLIDLVSKGMGISILTNRTASYFAGKGVTLLNLDPEIPLQLNLVYKTDRRQNPGAVRFMKLFYNANIEP